MIPPAILDATILLAALAAAVVGGVFFAFSTFVIAALDRLPAAEAVAAMRAINRVVLRSGFVVLFLATATGCMALAGIAAADLSGVRAALAAGGAAVFLAGSFGVTAAFNVPLNDALAASDPADAAAAWRRYARVWSRWNHWRTAASVGSAALLLGAAMAGGRPA